jgi:hypothetical protein
VRILVAAPPKTGNMWLKCLLGTIYDLRWLKPREQPREATLAALRVWIDHGGFADGTIFHQHYDYADEICDIVEAVPAHLVTLVRNPYDAFVSTYYTLQQHHADDNRKRRRMTALMGKALDDPEVIAFLREGGYRNNLVKARDWMGSGRARVVRYETLHADPVGELVRLSGAILPVPPAKIERAVETCSAANMRLKSLGMAKHVRAAKPDDARQRLTDQHYAAFREGYADLIQALGYDVR